MTMTKPLRGTGRSQAIESSSIRTIQLPAASFAMRCCTRWYVQQDTHGGHFSRLAVVSSPSSVFDGGLATFTISVHNPFSHPVVVSLPSGSGSMPISYGYAMRESSGAGMSNGDLAVDVGITYFAAGETKRDVIDFFVIAPDFPSYQGGPGLGESPIALPVGTYLFQGDYGGKAAPNLTVVLSQ